MRIRIVGVAFVATALAGCAVGPNFERPAAPAVQSYTATRIDKTTAAPVHGGTAQHLATGQEIPEQWWKAFHSQALNQWIAAALAHNPNVDAAKATLQQAQENVYAQRGAYFPNVSLGLSASRERDATGTLSPTAANGESYLNLRTAQVVVGFAPDVFGGNRRAVESAQAQAGNQRYALIATRLTLASNVAAGAIELAALRGQIHATQDMVASQTSLLKLMQIQFDAGAIAQAAVIAQQAALAQTQAQLPPLQKQLEQQRDALAALTGIFPAQWQDEKFALSDLALPADLPLSLPSQLVRQRPDVLAAEASLHAASAQVGVAEAARFPQFTLDANYGSTATRTADLFKSGNILWNVAGGLTQPIFDAGTLKHRQRAAEAAYAQADAQYRSTVLGAFQNVADTLHALDQDARTLKLAVVAEKSAAESLAIARKQTALGDTSIVAVLQAEQVLQQTRLARIQAQAARFADTVALYQALGGGWSQSAD